ncbi:DUF2269 family protein [Agromyces cerinus]|uniref:Predicted integral membrane protein n=1 Tax=Agromyces cerinus subsp. cerinus TaxID=232089 RepID=A0A1N6DGW6_9MICO|nr:DUF2269 family protein [Agromyces cerinus]SIN69914.1 Predicted integral membrane protein [Agromyces cerinus subsp. cerinus]
MDTFISILHVAGAVFIVGPMAILPMTAMRAVRAGNGSQVAVLAKSTTIFAWLSLLVFVFGFGAMSMAPEEYELSMTTPWILWSIILYIIAFALTLFVVVPSMKKAAAALGETAGDAAAAPKASYPAIAAGSGISSLLLLAVVVLMVWKP